MITKRILLLLALSVFAISLINAQKITCGIQVGGGVSSLSDVIKPKIDQPIITELDDYYTSMFSYNLNAFVGYNFGSFWGITLEPGFIQKGAKAKDDPNSNHYNQVNLNCLQLPVLADLYFGKKITISLGSDFSYLLSAKAKLDDGSLKTIEAIFTKAELSGILGVNYALSDKFDVGIRYNHGITPIMNTELIDEDGIIMTNKYKIYNQYSQFYLRFKI